MWHGKDIELRDYLRVISARRWLIITAIAVVTMTALVASLLQRPVYQAQSVLLVRERTSSSLLSEMLPGISMQPERSIQTHIRLAQMPAVIDAVLRQLRGQDPALAPLAAASDNVANRDLTADGIRSALTVDADPQTNLLYVNIQDSDPRRAATIANAVATQYVRTNRAVNAAEIHNAGRELSYRQRDTQEDILALQEVLDRKSPKLSKTARRNAKARLKMAQGVYQMLAAKQEQLKISESIESGEALIVQPAQTPDTPVRPVPVRNTLLGLVLGMSLGIATAFTSEYLDNTLKTSDDVERAFGLPVLGQVPLAGHGGDDHGANAMPELLVTPTARTPSAEAYRALRTSLSYLNYDGRVRTILVTSSNPAEGKTSITANLAAALANAGYRVLLVDADMRKPRLHTVFGARNDRGLTDVLVGQAAPEQVVQRTEQDRLQLIACGPMPPNPSELLNSARMQEVLQRASRMAEFVVIDSAPVLAVTDCAVLAPNVDGVLVVAEAGVTTREDAERTKETLASECVRLLGVVLNKVDSGPAYGYYSYHHGQEARQQAETAA